MTRPVREESHVPRLTRYVPGCFRFRGYAALNPTAKRAMQAVIAHAAAAGRAVRWVGASS